MTGPVLNSDTYTDFQGLSELRSRARSDSEASLREVAGQFEALFIQMMLKSMRDASLGEGLLDSEHTKTYQAMFDKQISIDLSKRQGLGLAEMMVRQLSRAGQNSAVAMGGPAPRSPTQQAPVHLLARGSPTAPSSNERSSLAGKVDWNPESPRAFVRELWPHARRAAQELGTEPEVLIAQAALETGWGRHMIKGADGRNSLNLFGVKADARWQGRRVSSETVEFSDGVMRKERASFRAYGSLGEAFADYADFLKSNPRYSDALAQAQDGADFARALAAAGYATDPDYSRKITAVMRGEQLRHAVSGIKESDHEPLS